MDYFVNSPIFIDLGSHKGEIFKWCFDHEMNVKIDNKTGHRFFRPLSMRDAFFCLYEPNINMIPKLEEWRSYLDGKCNICIENKAVWINNDSVNFSVGSNTKAGKISDEGTTVKCIHILDVIGQVCHRPYSIVKMDVEGAEYDLLERLLCCDICKSIGELHIEWHNVRKNRDRKKNLVEILKDRDILYKEWLH